MRRQLETKIVNIVSNKHDMMLLRTCLAPLKMKGTCCSNREFVVYSIYSFKEACSTKQR